jgi:hypothetical protein
MILPMQHAKPQIYLQFLAANLSCPHSSSSIIETTLDFDPHLLFSTCHERIPKGPLARMNEVIMMEEESYHDGGLTG